MRLYESIYKKLNESNILSPEQEEIIEKYLPSSGEGENKAQQAVTALNKIIYGWYNDGEIYDTSSGRDAIGTGVNNLSTYANWLYRYTDLKSALDEIEHIKSESDYDEVLTLLSDLLLVPEKLEELEARPKVDSIYKCVGHFFTDDYNGSTDEEDDWGDDLF